MNEISAPPAIQLLMEGSFGAFSSFSEFTKRYKKIASELAAQAEWGYDHHNYYDEAPAKSSGLIVSAAGGLNPFSDRDICSAPACRIKTANDIARTLGLYADVITIPDPISYALIDNKRPTTAHMSWILSKMLILRELYPLIQAGVIRFWSGRSSLCEGCFTKAEQKINDSTSELTEDLDKYLHVEMVADALAVRMTGPFEGPIVMHYKVSPEDKKRLASGLAIQMLGKEKTIESVRAGVRHSLFELNHSTRISSVLFSTSRRELLALRNLDSEAPALSTLALWEKARSIQLPWVNELSIEQILRLRQEAHQALPAFRGTFVRHIASPTANAESVEGKIEELRENAFDVERELRALNLSSEQRFRNIAGSLGITISVYGFASGFAPPAVALGGLMTILGLVHSSARHDQQKLSELRSQPGYVLLAAKELAEHA